MKLLRVHVVMWCTPLVKSHSYDYGTERAKTVGYLALFIWLVDNSQFS